LVLGVLGVLRGGELLYRGEALLRAQFQMPDPKQMSGIPRPVADLPDHAISVRLIRGDLSNNIANHPVQLRIGSKTVTVKTDESGRAQFNDVTPGAPVRATADVDGEHLESQEFPAPDKGGVRLMLVATDKSKGPATEPNAAPISGQVVIGNQSRIVMEPTDEAVDVYYLLDIENTARVPVNPSTPFVFDVPPGATGTGLMQGSSPLASVKGKRVTVQGPFPPGQTLLQVGYEIAVPDGSIGIEQRFPATFMQLGVAVKKVGDVAINSPQIAEQRELPAAAGDMYIAGRGGTIAAGQPIVFEISGVPHHSSAPRYIALTLAVAIVVVAAWSSRPREENDAQDAAERKRLVSKRDRLLNDLVRLENDRRSGRADPQRSATRREELVAALERIYGALDSDDAGPEPLDRAGVAARMGELRAS
jgi:hypothetical protein